jgi:AcrR family transcriptional regulator
MTTVSAGEVGSSDSARHIARTAARLFALRGFEATSVREIVEAAGVTKPTLYYHFGSKDGLAQALLHRPLTGLVETLHALAVAEGDPVERLAGIIEAHFAFCREEPDRARFYYAICIGPHASGLAVELMKHGPRLDEPIALAVEALTRAGVVAPERAADLLRACRGAITSTMMEFLYPCHDDEDPDLGPTRARRLVDDLLWGFAARGDGRPEGTR